MASTWHTVATRDVRLLRHQLEQVFRLPGMYTFLNYLRCHDDIGWGLDYDFLSQFGQKEVPHKKYLNDYFTGKWPGSPSRGELYNDDPRLGDARMCGTTASLCGIQSALDSGDTEALKTALRLDIMLHAYMFTLSGIPVLYAGDEIGQLNDDSYHSDPLKAGDSRYLHRGNMNWDNAAKRHDDSGIERELFSAIQRMEAIRREHAVFGSAAAARVLPCDSDAVLGIERSINGEILLAYFNFSDDEQVIRLNARCEDLWSAAVVDSGEMVLPGKGFAWLRVL